MNFNCIKLVINVRYLVLFMFIEKDGFKYILFLVFLIVVWYMK